MASVHKFEVEMTCEGCSGAVERILNRLKTSGVESFDISLTEKRVTITSTMTADELLDTLKKTGKKVTYLGQQ
ncbi:antioxidant 1 copper chaperone [Arctopsyche grandis]|uniref:antioxidant 1 copper chaperone n=1 Tax=Arctopsyche grandis TaxID=121162 RepID=UPI00406D9DC2